PQSNALINGDASKLLKSTFEEYFRRSSSDTKHWKYIYKNFTNIVIPYFGAQKRLTEITPKDIRALLQTKESKPQMMRIIYSNLRGFFNYCVMEEYLDRSPIDKIQAPKTSKPRKRYLTREEIKIFWDASKKLPYPHSQFYRFCLLTAQR